MDRTLSYHRFLPNTFLKGCTKMRIALASDHAGYAEKEQLKPLLKDLGVEFEDLGTASDASVDYPEYARRVAEKVSHGEVEQGDRKSTRLNSSHSQISYAVFCLKKKNS